MGQMLSSMQCAVWDENSFQFKGALDKYNIYHFISNSIEDFRLNRYRNFQLILPMRFHFTRYFVNSIISRVSHRYCIVYLLKSILKNRKYWKYSYFFKSKLIWNVKLSMQSAVITNASTSNGTKIPTFFGKSWGIMLHLSNAPLNYIPID